MLGSCFEYLLFALALPWILATAVWRRLWKGPRHPDWSWPHGLMVEVMRRRSGRYARLSPTRARRSLPSAPAWQHRRHLTIEHRPVGGVPAEVMTPKKGWGGHLNLLYFHGGGYCVGSYGTHRDFVGRIARTGRVRTFSLNYRLAPEHPFPAAIDDAEAAYEALLEEGVDTRHLTVGGDSAGGGLTLALLQRLRDKGLPMPAQIILISPWVDMTLSGESIATNGHLCYLSEALLERFASWYCQPEERSDPLASPLNADLRGFPPTLLLTGQAEGFYSEDLAFGERARAAGLEVDVHVGAGMVHAWPALTTFLPEGRAAMTSITEFVQNLRT